MRTTENLIILSNSLFLPFRSGRKWPGIYSSHNGQWEGRLHWERSANPRRWWWRYTIWDSQTEAKDGYYGRDILWQSGLSFISTWPFCWYLSTEHSYLSGSDLHEEIDSKMKSFCHLRDPVTTYLCIIVQHLLSGSQSIL